jgi:hypothetical protein
MVSSISQNQTRVFTSDNESSCSSIDDDTMALFVRKFGKMLKKKGYTKG